MKKLESDAPLFYLSQANMVLGYQGGTFPMVLGYQATVPGVFT